MSKPIDIRNDHLAIVQNIIAKHLPPNTTVWVFGSRATWLAKSYSDLDLALEHPNNITSEHISNLETAFDESDLPWKVDVLDLSHATPAMIKGIDTHKIRLPLAQQGSNANKTIGRYLKTWI